MENKERKVSQEEKERLEIERVIEKSKEKAEELLANVQKVFGTEAQPYKDTEVPAYKVWNEMLAGKLTRAEARNQWAKMLLANLRDFGCWTYPIKSGFVGRYMNLEGESRDRMMKTATEQEKEQLKNYLKRFDEVRTHNYSSTFILVEMQINLIDTADKERVVNFYTEQYCRQDGTLDMAKVWKAV